MPATPEKGPHYSLIKERIPEWLHAAAKPRVQALSQASLTLLPAFLRVPAAQHLPLKTANAQAWAKQNSVEHRLNNLADVYTFAEPLLRAALLQRYGLALDVRATHLLLVTATRTINRGTTSRSLSLLNAALQNFSRDERFTADSRYISQPDANGRFEIQAYHQRISIEQFVELCRELDIGAQYARHLQQHLLPRQHADRDSLQAQVIASQQAALNAAAHLALLRGEIEPATFHLVQRTVKGERGVMQFYRLRLVDTLLTGVLLIASDLDLARDIAPVVAYIPHDPKGAIQSYPSTLAFREALASKLQDPTYRQFFSQFVDQQQRQAFVSGVRPHAPYSASRIDGELWPQLYQAALNKILNDSRELAVSTALADSRARWAWWDSVSQTLEGVLNVGLMILSPFVPVLGEAMLVYTAYQFLDEVVEGVVDLAEGQAVEAAGHFVGVLSDVLQLAGFSVAGKFAQSVFVNGLKAVEVDGRKRLWNPDPRPYRHPLPLPPDSLPDALGLHHHGGQQILPVDGQHYALTFDAASGDHYVQHPTRVDAYQPPIRHNNSAQAWSEQRRLQELGPFSEAQQQQILAISGLDHDTLRAVQADDLPAPLLDDTLKRLRLNQQAHALPERLRAGERVDQDTYWSPYIASELPGWPRDRAILVYEKADLSGDHLRFGEPDAPHTLAISRDELNQGALPERLVDSFDEAALTALLGEVPTGHAAQVEALRNRLGDQFAQRRDAVFAYLYNDSEWLTTRHGVQVREAWPDLPKSLVQTLLAQARPDELAILDNEQRLPLRLNNIARELHLQARGAHAYQGFYTPQLFGPQTEQMVLDTLRVYSDSLEDCRIEIRQHTPIGKVRASAGPGGASQRRLLLRTNGGYVVYADRQARVQAPGDFFDTLLDALPVDKRQALGRAPGEGAALKGWVMDTLRAPEPRRTVLADPPFQSRPPKDAQGLVQKPMHPAQKWLCGLFPASLKQRVKALYPYAEPGTLETYLRTLDDPVEHQRFEAREIEKAELQHDLREWIATAAEDEPAALGPLRSYLSKALLRTWEENLDPDEQGIRLSLHSVRLGGALGNLRVRANFDHVLHLELIDAQLLDTDTPLLESFKRLQTLNLRDNRLSRLPESLTTMTSLTHLSLEGNPIQWEHASLGRLARMRRLRQLSMANNRSLTQAPDIGRMPHLEMLSLRSTGISDWPPGLFEQPRSPDFHLDLQNTAINNVPQFLPWQPEAEVVARARVDRNQLTADAEQNLISYRLAAGLDPYRSYPPKGDAGFWVEHQPQENQPWLRQIWQDIEQEHGSQGFFEVIKSLEPSQMFEDAHDEALYQRGRAELTDKVWRMLLIMESDEAMRTRLFQMASNPVTCADAGAYIFNAMGVEVLQAEINRDLRGVLREVNLAQLARGKSRLDRLNQIAKADVRDRIKPIAEGGRGLRLSTQLEDGVPGSVDEVEVYLAYHTGLRSRLQLPWVSPHMSYRATADVSLTQLNSAFDSLMRQEVDDGLVDDMLKQPFWDSYLRESRAPMFQASLDHAYALSDSLDDLLFAQNQWASATPSEQAAQLPYLLGLADALKVPHAEVLSGQPMTPENYERILAAGFTEALPSETNLARRLTREALQRLAQHEAHAV